MSPSAIASIYLFALLQLVLIYVLADTSRRLASWLWPQPNVGERFLVTGMIFCSLAVVLVIGLGVLGLLHPVYLSVVVVGLWLVCRWKMAETQPLPKLDIPKPMRWPLFLAGLLTVPFLLRSILFVPLAWDSLTYHLYFPTVWIQTGRVSLIDGVYPYNYLAFYPKHYELIETFFMIIVRNDVFTKLLNIPLIALTSIAAGLICYQLCHSKLASWCAGAFVYTIPGMFCWAATTYVEPLLNFAILTAVYFLIVAWRTEAANLWRAGLIAGLAVGMAAGTKYSAMYAVVVLCFLFAAVLVVRRPGWKTSMMFSGAFAIATMAVGVWWFAYNGIVTGNPVYPVPLGSLPAIVDPDRPTIESASILAYFGPMLQSGFLWRLWLGMPPPADNLFGVGHDLVYPPQMSFGFKLLIIIPLLLCGVCYSVECGWNKLHERSYSAAMVFFSVLAISLILLYTYLKLPFWGDFGNLFYQVRFAMPFVLLVVAMGFARLSNSFIADGLPRLVVLGIVLDALVLDLRIPGFGRFISFVLLFLIGYLLWKLVQSKPSPRPVIRVAFLVVLAGLFPLLQFRESDRYHQWACRSEVHMSSQWRFIESAHLLQQEHSGQKLAYAGDFTSLLYLFVGPQLDRSIEYVPTYDGPVASYKKQGALRDVKDRSAWEKNLKQSGAELLITFRFGDRQLKASEEWPIEKEWANDLAFARIYENEFCAVYRIDYSVNRASNDKK